MFSRAELLHCAIANLGPFQTSNLTCAESNANEKNLLFSLICIRFGTCKVRRLKRALEVIGVHSFRCYRHVALQSLTPL